MRAAFSSANIILFFRIENHKIVTNFFYTVGSLDPTVISLRYKNGVGNHHVYQWTKWLFNHDHSSSCGLPIAKIEHKHIHLCISCIQPFLLLTRKCHSCTIETRSDATLCFLYTHTNNKKRKNFILLSKRVCFLLRWKNMYESGSIFATWT